MESYQLNSKIVQDNREFLIQTVNDVKQGVIKSTLFADGEILDSNILPHSDDLSDQQLLNLVKNAHSERQQEIEYLLEKFTDVMDSGRVEHMFHLGTALFYRRMYDHALRLFSAAVKIKPDYHEALMFLAQTYFSLNRISEAIPAAEKAVEHRPQYADYRNVLGESYMAANSCKRAVIEFEEAIKGNVYYADAYFNLATAYVLNAVNREDFELTKNLTDKCIDLYKKAALIYPDYQGKIFNEAIQSLKGENYKRAYELFIQVREIKKERKRKEKAAYYQRFFIYTDWVSEESIQERIRFLNSEIDKNPDYVDLYYDLAVCHLQKARFEWQKGIAGLSKALEINQKFGKASRALDIAKEHQLRTSDAISDIIDREPF